MPKLIVRGQLLPIPAKVSPHETLNLTCSDVNKTTSLKTKTKTNVIPADNVIINGKVAIIVSFYSTIFCMFSLFFHHNFLCVVYI